MKWERGERRGGRWEGLVVMPMQMRMRMRNEKNNSVSALCRLPAAAAGRAWLPWLPWLAGLAGDSPSRIETAGRSCSPRQSWKSGGRWQMGGCLPTLPGYLMLQGSVRTLGSRSVGSWIIDGGHRTLHLILTLAAATTHIPLPPFLPFPLAVCLLCVVFSLLHGLETRAGVGYPISFSLNSSYPPLLCFPLFFFSFHFSRLDFWVGFLKVLIASRRL